MVSPTGAENLKKLLDAQSIDEYAGQLTRQCESCGFQEVPVGPCYLREQIKGGFSNPNTRICMFAARRPLNTDIYPPFDTALSATSKARFQFTPRESDWDHKSFYRNSLLNIDLKETHVKQVSDEFQTAQVVVLKAPTGFGKSTKLPYLLCWHQDSRFSLNPGRVIVAEPKRLAAENVANTVSRSHQNLSPGPGLDVGLQHGGVSDSGESNKLMFVTDGSLVNRLLTRELEDVQLIIVDEAHERNERIELILMLLRFLLPQYPHLRLLILSATIEPSEFKKYFEPETESTHFLPVRAKAIEWQPVAGEPTREIIWGEGEIRPRFKAENLADLVRTAVIRARDENGHVLVFLPGEGEIADTQEVLERNQGALRDFNIVRLLGSTPQKEKDRISNAMADQGKLLILATNVAESSVTFKDLACVVDSGLRKISQQDDLVIEEITKAELKQRQGRVGRNREGWYFANFSEKQSEELQPYPNSQLVELSDYNLQVLLLRAMSLGIEPNSFLVAETYLLAPEKLTIATKRVLKKIRKEGGLATDEKTEREYLTPLGILAATTGISLQLASLLMVADHHNVLTEVSALVAVMASRRESTRLTPFDDRDLLPDHVEANPDGISEPTQLDSHDPADANNHDDDDDEVPDYILDDAGSDDESGEELETFFNRSIEGDLRDAYLLESFDKLEEVKFGHVAALMKAAPVGKAKNEAFLRLQKVNQIRRVFQERVPEERIRETDPRLFGRAQMVVDHWRTGGWSYEVSMFADANLINLGLAKKTKPGGKESTSSQREKNTQMLWEMEGVLVRTHRSKADIPILYFAQSLTEANREFRVVSNDKFIKELKSGNFESLRHWEDWRVGVEPEGIEKKLKTYLKENKTKAPLEIILDPSNIARNGFKEKDQADISKVQDLLWNLAEVCKKHFGAQRTFRHSLIENLGRPEWIPVSGRVTSTERAALVPELLAPVGSRWKRGEDSIVRDDVAEEEVIELTAQGRGQHSIVSVPLDEESDDGMNADESDVWKLLTKELHSKCFHADLLKKQYLSTPAKEAQEIRQLGATVPLVPSERVVLPQANQAQHFRVVRNPENQCLNLLPSYLESQVIKEMKNADLGSVKFKVYRDRDSDHFLQGRVGTVKTISVQVDLDSQFHPIIELGAWQVCPWFSAVPDSNEWGAETPKKVGKEKKTIRKIEHSHMPDCLTEFDSHELKIVRVGDEDRLLCISFDGLERWREEFLDATRPEPEELAIRQARRVSRQAKLLRDHHYSMWKSLRADVSKPEKREQYLRLHGQTSIEPVGEREPFKVSVDSYVEDIKIEKTQTSLSIYSVKWVEHPDFSGRITVAVDAAKSMTIGQEIQVRVSKIKNGTVETRLTNSEKGRLGHQPKKDYSKDGQRPKTSDRGVPAASSPRRKQQTSVGSTEQRRPASTSTRRGSKSSSSRPKKSRFARWLMLFGLVAGVLYVVGNWPIGDDSAIETESTATASDSEVPEFPPRTESDWYTALNCTEDPSERETGSVASAIRVCYSLGDTGRNSISLFFYENPPGDSELKNRLSRACSKRGATGEVYGLYSEETPSVFIYTIYQGAVRDSQIAEYFERLNC